MSENNERIIQPEIIGIDHGFKNIKTANYTFSTAISELKGKPENLEDILEVEGRYFSLNGEPVFALDNHDKSNSEEFYLLTLVALAKELMFRKKQKANVVLVAGLPIKWYDRQKESFKKMLLKNKELRFSFEGKKYFITIDRVRILMQGVSAIGSEIQKYLDSYCVVVDIGGETIDVIPLENGKPRVDECKIDTEASIFCINDITEKIESECYKKVREHEIISAIINGRKVSGDSITNIIQEELEKYAAKVMRKIKGFRFDLERTPIIFVGGGSYIIKNYGRYSETNTSFILDINANAKGYERTEKALILKSQRSRRG